jgi:hypothetical protein
MPRFGCEEVHRRKQEKRHASAGRHDIVAKIRQTRGDENKLLVGAEKQSTGLKFDPTATALDTRIIHTGHSTPQARSKCVATHKIFPDQAALRAAIRVG